MSEDEDMEAKCVRKCLQIVLYGLRWFCPINCSSINANRTCFLCSTWLVKKI